MDSMRARALTFIFSFLFIGIGAWAADELPLKSIQLPPGFKISVYARADGARSLAMSPSGTLYIGTRRQGNVYAVTPGTGNGRRVIKIAQGLEMPNGVAFYKSDLFVAETSRIIRFPDIEKNLNQPPSPKVVYDKYPHEISHGWKFLAMGPDGYFYVPVGAPCNTCESDNPVFASITRLRPDGSGFEIFARGIRNSVGFDWEPKTGVLWFTDNGRDWLGDDRPPDELNKAPRAKLDFGYPYCHGKDILDPELGQSHSCSGYVEPEQELGPHVAALGMRFYTGTMFPEKYRGRIFIAEHGSWNRSVRIGYRVTTVTIKDGKAVAYEPFAQGWEKDGEVWGRPVDVLVMKDGSLLVSDDESGTVYRITY